jgi:hypothetical protein
MPMSVDDMVNDALCLGIIHSALKPLEPAYTEGFTAHANGLEFREFPYAQETPQALSWRIGWNDRALQYNYSDRNKRR